LSSRFFSHLSLIKGYIPNNYITSKKSIFAFQQQVDAGSEATRPPVIRYERTRKMVSRNLDGE